MTFSSSSAIRRIQFYQNRIFFKSSDGISFMRPPAQRLVEYRKNLYKIERQELWVKKWKKKGIMRNFQFLMDDMKSYFGRPPYEMEDVKNFHFQFNNFDEIIQFIENPQKLKTFDFWKYFCKKLIQERDVLQIQLVVKCLLYLKNVNYFDKFVFKVLVREVISEAHKLSVDDLSTVLDVYLHFNCYSDELIGALLDGFHRHFSPNKAKYRLHKMLNKKKAKKFVIPDALETLLSSTHISAFTINTILQSFVQHRYFTPSLFLHLLSVMHSYHHTYNIDAIATFSRSFVSTVKLNNVKLQNIPQWLSFVKWKALERLEEEAKVDRFFTLSNLLHASAVLSYECKQPIEEGLMLRMVSEALKEFYMLETMKMEGESIGLLEYLKDPLADTLLFEEKKESLLPFGSDAVEAEVSRGDDSMVTTYEEFRERFEVGNYKQPSKVGDIQLHLRRRGERMQLVQSLSRCISSVNLLWKQRAILLEEEEANNVVHIKKRDINIEVAANRWSDFSSYKRMYNSLSSLNVDSKEVQLLGNCLRAIQLYGIWMLSAQQLCDVLEILCISSILKQKMNLYETIEGSSGDTLDGLTAIKSVEFTDELNLQLRRSISIELIKKFVLLKISDVYRIAFAIEYSNYEDPYLLHYFSKYSTAFKDKR